MRGPEIHILGGYARRGTALILCSVLLGACSIPVPLKFMSWGLDAIAYLTAEKSVTDLGISLVVQQDCALWRGFTGEQICRSEDGTAIAVAAAEGPASGLGVETGAALAGSGSDDRTLATLAPAAGPAGPGVAAFGAAQKVSGKKAEYRQDRGRPEQAQVRVLVRLPAIVHRRLYGWPDRRPAPDTWLGPGLRTVFHGMRRDAVETGPSFGAEPGD